MYQGKSLWLPIIAMLMVTTVGIAQDKDRNPDERPLDRNRRARAIQDRTATFVRQTIIPSLQRTSNSVGERYNLDETTVNELRQSIHESVEALLKQPVGRHILATAVRKGNYDNMLETLLSQTDFKVIFAKYLSEEQLHDYMDFILARRQRNRGAVARHLTAWLDQQLSLTVNQREKIEQRLIASAAKSRLVDAGDILWNRLRPQDVVRQGFKYPPDDVLSQTQLAIWGQLVVLARSENRRRIRERARRVIIAEVKAKIMEDLKAGRIDRGEVELWLEFRDGDEVEVMEIELWEEDRDGTSESEEKMRRIAAAKLAAHTEQLGPLDERALQRLTLVAKGVVEEYLEAQDDDWETKYEEIHKAVVAGKMTRQEVGQRLEGLKRQLHAEEHATNSDTDITHHPLYQQTIEDVLSAEAFAQYKALQAERQAFRQRALRDVLVASMDTELFLSDGQRKHFETTAEEVLDLPMPDEVSAPVYMVYQLFQRTDHELLSPQQREEFERIYREIEREVRFAEKK